MTTLMQKGPGSAKLSFDDHTEIIDALYRFAAGQDLRDRALFDSAFSPQARLDFTGPARRLGADVPVFIGRKNIGDTIFANLRQLDTTHAVTNPRVTSYDGGHATLFALVEAQHLPRSDHARHLMLKNIYTARLSRDSERWVIDYLWIENIWMMGDPSVLFPRSPA